MDVNTIMPPNYVDQKLDAYFPHINIYLNEKGFDGIWRVRCGVRRQDAYHWPVNYHASGTTMIGCLMELRTVLIHAMEIDDLNSEKWRMDV
jgi:hypothetical protein